MTLFERGMLQSKMALRNATSSGPVTGGAPAVVSLTSYGKRIDLVHLTIESIARGTIRPKRLILWLDSQPDVAYAHRSRGIRRLLARGLEIGLSTRIGPHSKYFPYVLSASRHSLPLVTADDDIFYPKDWLASLVDAHTEDSASIHCFRAHDFGLSALAPVPYMSWQPASGREPRFSNFLTGVSGVIYPAPFLEALYQESDGFREVAPKADDVWLHSRAVENDTRIALVTGTSKTFPVVIGTQRGALWRHNTDGNDAQIRATYSESALKKIAREKSHVRS